MAGAGGTWWRTNSSNRDRPPPKFFLPIGGACFGINHLSVVLNNGLMVEALMMGCWLVLMGGWVLVAGRTFDAIWAWVDRTGWRVIPFVLLSFVASVGAAWAVAWFGYGQPLFG
jgi:hypothetical protein